MIITAVLAVALGVAPVKDSDAPQIVNFNEAAVAAKAGAYTYSVRKNGSTEVSGVDGRGRRYHLTIAADGRVSGEVGVWEVSFDVKDPA